MAQQQQPWMSLRRLDALQLAESGRAGAPPAGWTPRRFEAALPSLRALQEQSRVAADAEEAGARFGAEVCAASSPRPR